MLAFWILPKYKASKFFRSFSMPFGYRLQGKGEEGGKGESETGCEEKGKRGRRLERGR